MTTKNIITIKGGAFADVKKALKRWLEMYTQELSYDFVFELYKNGKGNHILKADARLENYLFFTLVNYLKYPNDIDYKIDVEGFTIAEDANFFPKETLGNMLLAYIPSTDTEYDYVLALTESNEAFKINLGRKVARISNDRVFTLPEIDFSQLQDPEIVKLIYKTEKVKKQSQQDKFIASIDKRFRIFLYCILGLFVFSILTARAVNGFLNVTSFLGLFIWCWIFTDYKMLRVDKYYYYCLLIASFLFLYGVFLRKKIFNDDNVAILIITTSFPLIFLIVQRPIRLLFIKQLGREPVIDRPAPSMFDGFYTISLVAFTVLVFFALISAGL